MANYGMIQLPQISDKQLDSEKERRQILNYLALLDEKLRYMFQNIDIDENLSEESKEIFFKYGKDIANIIKDTEGNFSMLRQDINGITTEVQNTRGDISLIQQRADALAVRMQNAEGDIMTLDATAESILTRVQNAEGDISTVEQTADKINWLVKSGTSAANFTLTSRMASLIADEIDITGFVTFTDLERSGKTEINGDNITTGTIDADYVTLGSSYGGFGCASGNDGRDETKGAKMYGSDQDNYFIATESGVRMTYNEDYSVHCTSRGVTLVGDYDFRAATNFCCLKDGAASLGTSSYHWDVVFADTGTINTSDRRKKHEIDYAMRAYEELFRKLKPCTYKLNNGTSGREHVGFIAQDIAESMEEIGMDSGSFAGFIKSPVYEKKLENGEPDTESEVIDYNYSLRYSEFVALNTMMIQKMMKRIEELEAKIAELERKGIVETDNL